MCMSSATRRALDLLRLRSEPESPKRVYLREITETAGHGDMKFDEMNHLR
jgi:hypothetical protein